MKRIDGKFLLVCLLTLLLFAIPMVASAVPLAPLELETMYASDLYMPGIMFDVVAINPIRLDHVDVNLEQGTHDIEIWAMQGSFQDDPTNASGNWTRIGEARVTSLGTDVGTPVPIDLSSIGIIDGDSCALYIYCSGDEGANTWNTISSTGALGDVIADDENVEILMGINVHNHFDPEARLIIWNGTLYYNLWQPGAGFDLTVIAGPGGQVEVTSAVIRYACDVFIPGLTHDTPIMAVAIPDAGYRFVGWQEKLPVGEPPVAPNVLANPLNFLMPPRDVYLEAIFEEIPVDKPVVPPTGDSLISFMPLLTVLISCAVASVPLSKRRER